MRRLIRTTGIAAAGFVLALGVAGATDRDEQAPESRAYLSLSFGGERVAPRNFHYGLRVDHDSRFVDGSAPPLMQFDFTRRGLYDARLNGLTVLKQSYRLRQSEEEAAAEAGDAPADEGAEAPPAEEGGFFSNMWGGVTGFFGGLFGGDEEEATETAEAESTEAPPEDLAQGPFMSYGIVDWGLFALGVAGLGLVAAEVVDGDETRDSELNGGGDGGDDDDGGDACLPDTDLCLPPLPLPLAGQQRGLFGDRVDPEYQRWLDGGTGHMGDLGG